VLWHGPDVGDPFGDQVDAALLRITVEEVVDHSISRLHPTASSLS
jgi:hypothetical protein